MGRITRLMRGGLAILVLVAAASCGGGDPPGSTDTSPSTSSGTSGSSGSSTVTTATNSVPVIVDGGPTTSSESVNTLFTTVTICVPGSTTQCQTIDHIQVDTGSYGLRVLAPILTLALQPTQVSAGNTLVECTQFVDGYSWGPIALADVQVGGESASSVPVQVIGSSDFTTVPDACSSIGPSENTVATFGANGILGIGVFAQDCGTGCEYSSDPGYYYVCSDAGCSPTMAPLTSQVLNPVPLFATDNNGTIIDLPAVAVNGAATVTGSLIFGIDTETNNASGTQTVLAVNPGTSDDSNSLPGNFTIVFNGQTFSDSFIDSGTNGIYFTDSALPVCTDASGSDPSITTFYCPASTQDLTATLEAWTATGLPGTTVAATFSVANAETLFDDNPSFTALPALGGTYSGSTTTFDFGLPFYFGRRVATAIEGRQTAVGTGPYIAF